MLTVAIPKRNKLQNIIVLTPKDGWNCGLLLKVLNSGSKTFPLVSCGRICYLSFGVELKK